MRMLLNSLVSEKLHPNSNGHTMNIIAHFVKKERKSVSNYGPKKIYWNISLSGVAALLVNF